MPLVPFMFLLLQGTAPSPRADTARAVLTAQISESSSTPFFFAVVTGIAIDAAGRVFVSDGGEQRVAVFTANGNPLGTIGRKGKGPGEFEYPTGPAIGPNGALYVRNMSSVSRFVNDPRTGLPGKFDKSFEGPMYAPWMSKQATPIDRAGRLYFPIEWGTPERLAKFAFRRYALDGRALDSIGVPTQPTERSATASVMISAGGGRMLKGLNVVPFHPVPVFAVTAGGSVFGSPSDSYLLHEWDAAGRVVRTIRRPLTAPRIPADERADSARALARRIDSLTVPISQVRGMSDEVKTRTLPTTYPVFRSLSVAADGSIWARRWDSTNRQRRTSTFDVLSESGAYVRTVIVPADCATMAAPVIRGAVLACVQLDLDTDVETVVIARIPSSAPGGVKAESR